MFIISAFLASFILFIELSRYDCFRQYFEEHEEEPNYGQTDDLAYFEGALCGYGRSGEARREEGRIAEYKK